MKIAISTESASDLTKELISQHDVKIVPLTIILGEEEYFDGEGIKPTDLFDYYGRSGKLPRTAAVNEFQFEEHFNKIKAEGYDAIIHITISSKASMTNANARSVAEKMENVFVVDSKSLSGGTGLLTLLAADLVKENKLSIKEIVDELNNRVPSLKTTFVIDTLVYLHAGGRCSSLAAFAANLLNLKPMIVADDGKLISGRKYRGKFAKVVKEYINDVFTENTNIDLERLYVVYSTIDPSLLDEAVAAIKAYGVKDVIVNTTGSTISTHCGPNTLGILFFTK